MSGNKTQATDASVAGFIAAVEGEERRRDCGMLAALMERATGEPAVMWGEAIVGFGRYHYRYASGREGDWALVGFSPRKGDISIYLDCASPASPALLARLGRHRMGKACLYIRRLADVDPVVLEQLVVASIAETRRRHG